MSKPIVAVQVYSVREDAEKDFLGTLKQLKAMGYEAVELAGFYGKTAQEIRAALDEAGISAVSAHVPYDQLKADAEKTVSDYVHVGCRYIAIPFMQEMMQTPTPEVLDSIRHIGEVCKKHGATLLYHNHNFEFGKTDDGRYILDYLYESVSADLLQVEVDTCWVNVAGLQPAEYIRKYKGRLPIVHFKDYFTELPPATQLPMEAFQSGKFEMRPVGSGVVDYDALMQATLDIASEIIVVEQDFSVGRPALEAVKMSREFLRSKGW